MADLISIITIVLASIGAATILLRAIAPLTKTNIDNKILKVFEWLLENISLDSKSKIVTLFKEKNILKIPLKR